MKLQLVASPRIRLIDRPQRQLKHRMRPQANGKTPSRQLADHLADPFLSIDINHVYGELHEKSMNSLAGNDPQSLPPLQSRVFEKALIPLRAAVGDVDLVAKLGSPRRIAHAKFQEPFYNTPDV
jgi:hypothetical protein